MGRTISQAELRNDSAAVLDALEAGEEFIITRNGVPVGELRPIRPHRALSAAELVELFASLPTGSTSEQIRAEADEVFREDGVGSHKYSDAR